MGTGRVVKLAAEFKEVPGYYMLLDAYRWLSKWESAVKKERRRQEAARRPRSKSLKLSTL